MRLTDVLSGYRAFTAEVARILPVVSSGFEVETEMTVQALFYNMTISEVDIEYRARPEGSVSKLRSYRDGLAIALQAFHLLRAYKPLTFFGGLGLVCIALARRLPRLALALPDPGAHRAVARPGPLLRPRHPAGPAAPGARARAAAGPERLRRREEALTALSPSSQQIRGRIRTRLVHNGAHRGAPKAPRGP